ncbi:MAG: HAD family phosphatase [Candidatus Marsarchaeota archaeon]|nr:HAD family phosphatase [Candidatus Marsarchaeota archaeon]MCL5106286.1 HAD family phosphatase [Candidatus Marsarchaeota archaeon]
MIKAIIFDMGGVIVDYKENQYYDYLSKKYSINRALIPKVFDPLIEKMECGKMKLDEMLRIVSKKLGITKEEIEWTSAFRKIGKRDEKMIGLLKRLSKNYKVYLLSNISKSRYTEALKDFINNETDLFDKRFASCYIGLRKPDKRIYRYVLKNIKVKANEAVFIDDRKENIKGAESVGIHGILCTNYIHVLSGMKKLGIKAQ